MSDYTPSKTFTAKVMKQIRELHERESRPLQLAEKIASSTPLQFVFAGGATCIGLLNLARIYFTLFSPVICK